MYWPDLILGKIYIWYINFDNCYSWIIICPIVSVLHQTGAENGKTHYRKKSDNNILTLTCQIPLKKYCLFLCAKY